MKAPWGYSIRIAVLFAMAAVPSFSQTFGEITGRITDSSGAAAPEATVGLTNVSTNAVRQTTSNQTGDYSFPSLPPGAYTLKVERQGFKTEQANDVQVQVQQTVRLDFTLAGRPSDGVRRGRGERGCSCKRRTPRSER